MKLTIDLPEELLSALQARADRQSVTVDDYIWRLLDQDLRQHLKSHQNPKFRHISEVLAEIMADAPPKSS